MKQEGTEQSADELSERKERWVRKNGRREGHQERRRKSEEERNNRDPKREYGETREKEECWAYGVRHNEEGGVACVWINERKHVCV